MRSLIRHIVLAQSFSLGVVSAPASESKPALVKRANPLGFDVSILQGNFNWTTVKSKGPQFTYIKASEGTTIFDANYYQNWDDATIVGITRGAYHVAHPSISTGAAQATWFLNHGGWWTADGITLPGAVDLEGDSSCANLTPAQMVTWINDFSTTYNLSTNRFPVIYTTTSWWVTCTGNSAAFASKNPLWFADYASVIGPLPAGWLYPTFWQYAASGTFPGGQDLFNGDATGLSKMALGS